MMSRKGDPKSFKFLGVFVIVQQLGTLLSTKLQHVNV